MGRNNIEFFPHTKTHPILARCTEETVSHEITESKRRIEYELGKPSNIFCYPNGRFIDLDDRVITLLKQSGYRAALTAEGVYDYTHRKIDLFRLKRYPFPDNSISFKRFVSGFETFISDLKRLRHRIS
jgi:peptidoglycan/xylan/chitin deacetylase (PgdA/CDA1 family)